MVRVRPRGADTRPLDAPLCAGARQTDWKSAEGFFTYRLTESIRMGRATPCSPWATVMASRLRWRRELIQRGWLRRGRLREVAGEPVTRQPGDLLERAWLLEEMRRTRH